MINIYKKNKKEIKKIILRILKFNLNKFQFSENLATLEIKKKIMLI